MSLPRPPAGAPAEPDLSRALKPIDSWWTVAVVDPLAMRLLPALLRLRWATANCVTSVAFVVGIVSVGAFCTGHWIVGGVLYELRFFLDCLDGKIARIRGTSSAFGSAFDRLADYLTVPAAYAAIGWVLADVGGLRPELAFLTALTSCIVAVAELSLDVTRARLPAATPAAPALVAPPSLALIRWARRHRLTLRPWTVEAEALGLFLGPLFLRGTALGDLELALAGSYIAFTLVDMGLLFRTTRRQDRTSVKKGPGSGAGEVAGDVGDDVCLGG